MDSPVATVLSVSGGSAQVQVADASACPRCAAGNGCGAGIRDSGRGTVAVTARISNELNLVAGDRVTLSLAPRDLVRSALFVYGAPLAGLLLATGLSGVFFDSASDGLVLGLGLFGLLLGALAGRFLARRDACVDRSLLSVIGFAKNQVISSWAKAEKYR